VFGAVGPAPDAPRRDPADQTVVLAFAPMHKLAFGVAVGAVAGALLFALTAGRLLLVAGDAPTVLSLLSGIFAGYRESWAGAFVALGWGLAVGFVTGWFAAFVHNLLCAVWLLYVRARADLLVSRDVLDHI
jgi:hypothetical protein